MPLQTGSPSEWFQMGQAGGSRYSGMNEAHQTAIQLLVANKKQQDDARMQAEQNKMALAGHLAGAGYQLPQDMLSQYGLGGATKPNPTLPAGAVVTGGTMSPKGGVDTTFSVPQPPQPLPSGMVAKGATLDPTTGQWKMTAESTDDPAAQAKLKESQANISSKEADVLKKTQGIYGRAVGTPIEDTLKAQVQQKKFSQIPVLGMLGGVPGLKAAGGAFMSASPEEIQARKNQILAQADFPGYSTGMPSQAPQHTPQQIQAYNQARSEGKTPHPAAAIAGF